MKKQPGIFFLLFLIILLSGCTTTFAGSLFVFNFRDLILYIGLAFIFAVLVAVLSSSENRRRNFWIWFILSLVLTPLAGFIYVLVLFTRKNK